MRARVSALRVVIRPGDPRARAEIVGIVVGEIFLPRHVAVIVGAGKAVEIVVFVIPAVIFVKRQNLRDPAGKIAPIFIVDQRGTGGVFRQDARQAPVGGVVGELGGYAVGIDDLLRLPVRLISLAGDNVRNALQPPRPVILPAVCIAADGQNSWIVALVGRLAVDADCVGLMPAVRVLHHLIPRRAVSVIAEILGRGGIAAFGQFAEIVIAGRRRLIIGVFREERVRLGGRGDAAAESVIGQAGPIAARVSLADEAVGPVIGLSPCARTSVGARAPLLAKFLQSLV